MNFPCRPITLTFLLSISAIHASPADAERVQKGFQLSMEKWILESRLATTETEREKAAASRPDPIRAAREMWNAIGLHLDKEWTLAPAAWFLKMTDGQITRAENGSGTPTFGKESNAIIEAVETHHLKSEALIPMCVALANAKDPRRLALLEKISTEHPDKKIQGVASLSTAMALKSLGDEAELLRKRLTLLRKAIIESADVEIDGSTVAEIAEDELYVIQHLTKGRVAPDLSGTDSAGRPIKLSDFQGKIIVLMFWSSHDADADRVIEITAAMKNQFRDKPVEIIGVNHDSLPILREMEADGIVTWRNFSDPELKLANAYRVGRWPLVYVLNGERKIHHAGAPGSFVELTAEALAAEIKPMAAE